LALNLGCLQQKQRYQAVENVPVCENNHRWPNLAMISLFMVPWGCPKDIGNKFIRFDT